MEAPSSSSATLGSARLGSHKPGESLAWPSVDFFRQPAQTMEPKCDRLAAARSHKEAFLRDSGAQKQVRRPAAVRRQLAPRRCGASLHT